MTLAARPLRAWPAPDAPVQDWGRPVSGRLAPMSGRAWSWSRRGFRVTDMLAPTAKTEPNWRASGAPGGSERAEQRTLKLLRALRRIRESGHG